MALTARNVVVQRARFRLSVDRFDADSNGTALIGPNGAGKTTLLLALQRLLPFRGHIEQTGRSAGVFAQPAVLRGPVLWNVTIVLKSVLQLADSAARTQAQSILESVGLSAATDADARELSAGQRQRLALARALAVQPRVLFLDEPFANVDADGRSTLRNVVATFAEQSGCALILATQMLADVKALCKTVVLLENGKIGARLDVTDIHTSENRYLKALISEVRND